jgi:hypothetical protein
MKKTKTKRRYKSKTLKKYNITYKIKETFINQLLYNWKKYTNGNISIDKNKDFKHDFYFSFTNKDDYNNHIHLETKHFYENQNLYNNIAYKMKRLDFKKGIVHSNTFKINVFSDPEIVVKNMIEKYAEFTTIS